MMKQMEAMQEQMRQKLAEASFTGEAQDGAVKVTCDGTRVLTNVSIDTSAIDPEDSEILEDLFLVAANRALEQAAIYEAEQGQQSMNEMLPGGLGGLLGG